MFCSPTEILLAGNPRDSHPYNLTPSHWREDRRNLGNETTFNQLASTTHTKYPASCFKLSEKGESPWVSQPVRSRLEADILSSIQINKD